MLLWRYIFVKCNDFQISNSQHVLSISHFASKRSAAWHSTSPPPFLKHTAHTLWERERATRYKSESQFIKQNISHIRVDLKWGGGGGEQQQKKTNPKNQKTKTHTYERKIRQKGNKTSYFSDTRAKHWNQIICLREKWNSLSASPSVICFLCFGAASEVFRLVRGSTSSR